MSWDNFKAFLVVAAFLFVTITITNFVLVLMLKCKHGVKTHKEKKKGG